MQLFKRLFRVDFNSYPIAGLPNSGASIITGAWVIHELPSSESPALISVDWCALRGLSTFLVQGLV